MKIHRLLALFFCLISATLAQEKIKVGVMIPLSGPFASYGDLVRNGIQREVQPGIEFVFEDEGCDPGKAVSAYKKLSNLDQVQYFIGPACGSPQEVVAPLLKGKSQLALLNSSASRAFFAASGQNMYSVQYAIEDESEFNAREMFNRGYKKVLLILFESQFSRTHERAFREAYKGQILDSFSYTEQSLSSLKPLALKVKNYKPDALYIPDAAPLMGGFLSELKKIGVVLPTFSVYSAQMPSVLEAEGKNAEGLFYSYPKVGDSNAIDYFPQIAVRTLSASLLACKGEYLCVKKHLTSTNTFDKYGILVSEAGLELKTVKDGKFVRLADVK